MPGDNNNRICLAYERSGCPSAETTKGQDVHNNKNDMDPSVMMSVLIGWNGSRRTIALGFGTAPALLIVKNG